MFSTSAAGPGVRVACALADASCDVVMLCPPVSVCRAIPRLRTISVRRLRTLEWSVCHAFKTVRPDIVIPCDDGSTEVLHDIHAKHPEWRPLIESSLGNPAMYPALDSRSGLLQVLAQTWDVPLPEWHAVCSQQQLEKWLDVADFTTPWVLKQEATSGGVGVRVVSTRQAAQRAFELLHRDVSPYIRLQRQLIDILFGLDSKRWSRAAPRMVAQRYILGRPANVAMFCHRGTLLASAEVEVLASETQLSPATAVRRIHHAGMRAAAASIAQRLELTGFHGVDFILEEGTGRAYVLELNARTTQTSHLHFDPDSDLIGAAARQWDFNAPGTPPLPETVAFFPHWGPADPLGGELEAAYRDVPRSCPELATMLLQRTKGADLFGFLSKSYGSIRSFLTRRDAASISAATQYRHSQRAE